MVWLWLCSDNWGASKDRTLSIWRHYL